MKKLRFLATTCLLLSACASTSTRDGLVHRDGSWYSPADAGRGDYYTGARHDAAWDHPTDFGIGLVPFGGYCPVRYRYCTSFWADPFYDPFWYYSWIYYRPAPRPHWHPHPDPRRRAGGHGPDGRPRGHHAARAERAAAAAGLGRAAGRASIIGPGVRAATAAPRADWRRRFELTQRVDF